MAAGTDFARRRLTRNEHGSGGVGGNRDVHGQFLADALPVADDTANSFNIA